MKISNIENKIYVECSMDEIYNPNFENKIKKLKEDLKQLKNDIPYKKVSNSAKFMFNGQQGNAKEIHLHLSFIDEKDLLEALEAKKVTDRKLAFGCEKMARIGKEIMDCFKILEPVFQFQCTAEKDFSFEKDEIEIKKIRPIMRYKIGEDIIRAELRQKLGDGNYYSAHIQCAEALSKISDKYVKLRSEIKGNKAVEMFTDNEYLENTVKISVPEDKVNIDFLNYELETLNSCLSKMGKNMEFSISSGISRIELKTKDYLTTVRLNDGNEPYNDFDFNFHMVSPSPVNRDVTVKYNGNIKNILGKIEKSIKQSVTFTSGQNSVVPLKLFFKEEKKEKIKTKEVKKNSKIEYSKKVQQRLL